VELVRERRAEADVAVRPEPRPRDRDDDLRAAADRVERGARVRVERRRELVMEEVRADREDGQDAEVGVRAEREARVVPREVLVGDAGVRAELDGCERPWGAEE